MNTNWLVIWMSTCTEKDMERLHLNALIQLLLTFLHNIMFRVMLLVYINDLKMSHVSFILYTCR